MSVDQRVRAALHAAADAYEPDEAEALRIVVARTGGVRRTRQPWRVLAAAIAVVAVVLVAVGIGQLLRGSPRSSAVAAAPLPGRYVVDVSETSAGENRDIAGRWVVVLAEDGTIQLTPPETYSLARTGSSYRTDGHTLRTDVLLDYPGCQAGTSSLGVYLWHAYTDQVQFVVVDDECAPRIALFTDQRWERLP